MHVFFSLQDEEMREGARLAAGRAIMSSPAVFRAYGCIGKETTERCASESGSLDLLHALRAAYIAPILSH
jgi:hypothetical protein